MRRWLGPVALSSTHAEMLMPDPVTLATQRSGAADTLHRWHERAALGTKETLLNQPVKRPHSCGA